MSFLARKMIAFLFLLFVFSLTIVATADDSQGLVSSTDSEKGPSFLKNDALVVARVGETNEFAAYSKHTGRWIRHEFPAKFEVQPVMGRNHVAFYVSGDDVSELVAIDQNGKWCTYKLPSAGVASCTPFVGDAVAAFNVGDVAYAFSGITGQWASAPRVSRVMIDSDIAMMISAERIVVFSAKNSVWAESPNLSVPE